MGTFLTAAQVDRLVADYEAGAVVKELAERYGIHRQTVFSHLRRRQVERHRSGLTEHKQVEAVKLYRQGLPLRAISGQMGSHRSVIRKALVEVGVEIRRRGAV